jgi:hypothetical protein
MFRFLTNLIRSVLAFFVGASVKEHAKECSRCAREIQIDSFRIREEVERKDDCTMRFVRENQAKLDAVLQKGEIAP